MSHSAIGNAGMRTATPATTASRSPRRWLAAGVLGAVFLGLGSPAYAVRLLDADEHSLDLDGAIKSFFFGLHMHQHPPALLAALGTTENRGGLAVADVRLKLEGAHVERYKWQVHFRSQALASSIPNAFGTLGTGGFARPPRWLPLQTTTPAGAQFQWYHEVDRLNLRMRFGPVDLILGRQAISFGVGFVWQPADLVATFSPIEVDREFKPGVDAVRLNVALGATTELAVVFAAGGPQCLTGRRPSGEPCSDGDPSFSMEHSVAVARLRAGVGKVDVGGIAGWVRGDVVAGMFLTAAIGRFRLRTETVLTHDLEVDIGYAGAGNAGGNSDTYVRSVLGLDYQFDTKKPLFLFGELYYNGFGARHAAEYLALGQRPRVAEFAEVPNLGVLYFAAGVTWEPHERLPVAFTMMSNLLDPSVLLTATVTYKLGDESLLVAGIYVPLADPPVLDPTSPNLLLTRSEFGLYPTLYFLSWKLYF